MCFDDALDGFDAYLKANRGLSANTRRAYRSDVEECLVALRKQGCVDLNEVTIEDLRLWMAKSSKNHARSSMARKTVAVRGFFAWAYDHDMASANPAASLQTPKIPDTLPAVLNETQAQQLMDRVDEDGMEARSQEPNMKKQAIALRDAAMLELRKNADISRQMVEIYAQENAAFLQRMGVQLNDANLYLAHFLGPQGAANLLRAAPNTPVDQILGADQINANRSILQGKTAGQVRSWAQGKMGGSETELAARQTLADLDAEAAKTREEEAKATQERIAGTNFEIAQQKLINGFTRGAEIVEAAISDALLEMLDA